MLILGQDEPSVTVPDGSRVSSVHGQPILPGGGGGSLARVGQRIRLAGLFHGESLNIHRFQHDSTVWRFFVRSPYRQCSGQWANT